MALLTIDQTAEHLGCSPTLVRRSIDRTRNGLPGGWPASTLINLTPQAGKATLRVELDALLEHLRQQAAA